MKRLVFATIIALTLSVSGASWVGAADLNNFIISDYHINLALDRDDKNRSILKTTETIEANFSHQNQNHGIERYIPKKYDGHLTNLKITSVTNEKGHDLKYDTYTSDAYTVLRIGDPDEYVHGKQKYEVSYTQQDVTKYFTDTKKSEFYWDTNGTEWRVPIQRLQVTFAPSESLQGKLDTDVQCYFGKHKESEQCDFKKSGKSYVAEANNLTQGQNITLAAGFHPDTFAEYQETLGQKLFSLWSVLQVISMPVLAIALASVLWRRHSIVRRKKDIGTVIPEYIPPKETSVYMSATMVGSVHWFAAQLIDLAVRHYLRVYETKAKSVWGKAEYEIKIVKSIEDLLAEEKEFLSDIYGRTPPVGAVLTTKDMRKDRRLAMRLADNPTKLKRLMREEYDLEQKDPERTKVFRTYAKIIGVLGILLASLPLLVLAVATWYLKLTWVRTDKAVDLDRYLQGFKKYISVAEKERLKMLQSPEGAEKTAVDIDDPKQLVRLYERVLPYAIMFNQEKEWSKQLGNYYEANNTAPSWYVGATVGSFNATAFSSSMSSMTQSINASGASHSSSGGSSGGGFSGGGGGGGGGGGW